MHTVMKCNSPYTARFLNTKCNGVANILDLSVVWKNSKKAYDVHRIKAKGVADRVRAKEIAERKAALQLKQQAEREARRKVFAPANNHKGEFGEPENNLFNSATFREAWYEDRDCSQ